EYVYLDRIERTNQSRAVRSGKVAPNRGRQCRCALDYGETRCRLQWLAACAAGERQRRQKHAENLSHKYLRSAGWEAAAIDGHLVHVKARPAYAETHPTSLQRIFVPQCSMHSPHPTQPTPASRALLVRASPSPSVRQKAYTPAPTF